MKATDNDAATIAEQMRDLLSISARLNAAEIEFVRSRSGRAKEALSERDLSVIAWLHAVRFLALDLERQMPGFL